MASTESHVTGTSRSSTPYEGDRRSSDEIRRDIERQRGELDVTTDTLQRKLAPRELAEQLWQDMRTRVGGGAGEMVDLVKRHPVPLGLIGAGIAWWIYESSSGRGWSLANDEDYDADEELGVGSMSTGSYGSSTRYSSRYKAGSAGYETSEEDLGGENWRQRSKRAVQHSTERLRDGASSARHGFTEAVDRNPLALGAACFSLGILAGIAVPSSGWEAKTMGGASAKVGRKAKDMATNVAVKAAEEGARAAQNAADRIRDEAERPSTQHRGTGEGDLPGTRWDGGSSGAGSGVAGTGRSGFTGTGSSGSSPSGTGFSGSGSTGSGSTGSGSTGTGWSGTSSGTTPDPTKPSRG